MRRTVLITTLILLACAAAQAQEKPRAQVALAAKKLTPTPSAASPRKATPPKAEPLPGEEVHVTLHLAPPAEPAAQMDEFETTLVNLRTALVRTSRTSFLTEERIPLGGLWRGRVELAAVQQRFHSANLYSVLPAASLAEVSATPGIDAGGRARTAYGLSLRIHFGRNEN